jgi:hypothetical protein
MCAWCNSPAAMCGCAFTDLGKDLQYEIWSESFTRLSEEKEYILFTDCLLNSKTCGVVSILGIKCVSFLSTSSVRNMFHSYKQLTRQWDACVTYQ